MYIIKPDTQDARQLGRVMRAARQAVGLTQQAYGARIGQSESTVRRTEHGQRWLLSYDVHEFSQTIADYIHEHNSQKVVAAR